MILKNLNHIKINNDVFDKMKWVALGLLLFFLFVTSLFPDIVITYTHSLNFLDCFFSGNFLEFYQYTLERQYYGFPADYYVMIYIIFGIWNLPIWILTKLCSIDPYSIGVLLWARTIVVVFIVGILWIIYKIFEILKEEQDEHVYFMICSSVLCIFPSFVMGQYDVVSLFFIMLGILQCLKEDKISWKALIIFAIAIPIKTLAIFPVILIILHQEKKILGIIKNIIITKTTIHFKATMPILFHGNISLKEIKHDLVLLKKEYIWLKENDSMSLTNCLEDLDASFTNFFEKRGRHPKFKVKGIKMNYLGRHILAESFDCDSNILNNLKLVEKYMTEAALECGATVVNKCFHLFNPHGVSGVVIISESHLAIHTWPEYGYAAVDLFTCGEQCDPKVSYEFLKRKSYLMNGNSKIAFLVKKELLR